MTRITLPRGPDWQKPMQHEANWQGEAIRLNALLHEALTRAKTAENRIEQLERERDKYAHKLVESSKTYSEMHIAIEQLEDKLAKAVEALRMARVHVANNADGWITSRAPSRIDLTVVDTALAEMEKTE